MKGQISNSRFDNLVDKMTLLDDVFFQQVFDDNLEAAAFLVEAVTGLRGIVVEKATAARVVGSPDRRSIELDLEVVAEDGSRFDVEVQKLQSKAPPERVRFYHSRIDSKLLAKGASFTELPDSYIIFLTDYDQFRDGLALYEVLPVVVQTGAHFEDGQHTFFVNVNASAEGMLGQLLRDFRRVEPNQMETSVIAKRAAYYKYDEEGRRKMGGVSEQLYMEGRAEGVAEGRAEGVALGEKRGVAKGESMALRSMARKLILMGDPLEKIEALTGLDIEVLLAMKRELT